MLVSAIKETPLETSDIFSVKYLEEQDTRIDLSISTTDKDIRMLSENKK
jgi:hypothetical protein